MLLFVRRSATEAGLARGKAPGWNQNVVPPRRASAGRRSSIEKVFLIEFDPVFVHQGAELIREGLLVMMLLLVLDIFLDSSHL